MKPATDAHRVVLRGGASAAVGYVIRFGARLAFLYMAARLFGVALFGAYSLAIALVELAVAAGGLGMKRYLFKLIEERAPDRPAVHVVIDSALLVCGASALLAAGIVIAAAALPDSSLADNSRLALLIAGPMVIGQALLDLVLAATRWKQKMRYEVTARSIVEPYAGIVTALGAYAAGYTHTGLLIGYWGGTLAALAFSLGGLRACYGSLELSSYRLSPRRLRPMLGSSALPTLSDAASALFARLDLYLVGLFLGEAPAGLYNMARQIRTPIRQVRQSLDGMLTPILARTLAARGPAETGKAAASATRLMLAIQLPMLIGLVAIGEPLLAWFGAEFTTVLAALLILALAETIQSAMGVGDLILLYRRPVLTLWITAASAASCLAAALWLIAPWGLDGAAAAVLIAAIVGALARRTLLRSQFHVAIPIAYSAGPIAAGLAGTAVAAALLFLGRSWPPVGAAAAAAAAGLAVYALGLKYWMRRAGTHLGLSHMQLD